jgi:hypothetical protein
MTIIDLGGVTAKSRETVADRGIDSAIGIDLLIGSAREVEMPIGTIEQGETTPVIEVMDGVRVLLTPMPDPGLTIVARASTRLAALQAPLALRYHNLQEGC